MKTMKNILLIIWQLPQTVVALILLYYYKGTGKVRTKVYFTSRNLNTIIYVLEHKWAWGFSLGYFVFITNKMFYHKSKSQRYITHECGHSLQSLYLSWLYLFVIGIPSLLITGINPATAQRCCFEKWAWRLSGEIIYRGYAYG